MINFGSGILGNRGITWIFVVITELSTALVDRDTEHERKNVHSKIIDIVTGKAFKKGLWDVE